MYKRYYGEPDVISFNGSCWPLENSLLYPDELGGKYHYKGETGLIWITKELKKYKFPVILGEYFVTEIVLYFQFQKPMKIKMISFISLFISEMGIQNRDLSYR